LSDMRRGRAGPMTENESRFFSSKALVAAVL
jgi:hypothetical protein